MTRTPDNGFGAQRLRDHDMMGLLARAVAGERVWDQVQAPDDLRQLGYAAYLVHGRVEDPVDNLGLLLRACHTRLRDLPRPERTYRDAAQARWAAPHAMDPRKLRTELPLHLDRAAVAPQPA